MNRIRSGAVKLPSLLSSQFIAPSARMAQASAFSTTNNRLNAENRMSLGFVPEHFATPIHLAYKHLGLADHVELVPFPAGTGKMIEALKAEEIDVAIGLTEGWIAGIAKDRAAAGQDAFTPKGLQTRPFHITGAYNDTPLRWAIITGGEREDVASEHQLKGGTVGISRIGSGSHVMANVLAKSHNWTGASNELPFQVKVCGVFSELRDAVKSGEADFFLWEHYTTKKFFDNGVLKRVGEITPPWHGWSIATRGAHANPRVHEVLLPKLDEAVKRFEAQSQESLDLITSLMEYSMEDARSWMSENRFVSEMGARKEEALENAVRVLQDAGVVQKDFPVDALFASE